MLKIKYLVISAILLINPFLFYTGNPLGDQVRHAKMILLFLTGASVASFICFRTFGRTIGVLCAFVFFNSVCTGFGTVQQNSVLCFSIAILAGYFLVNSKLDFHILYLEALILSGLLNCIMAYLQWFDLDPLWSYEPGVERTLPTAFFGQHTVLGPFISACAIACLFRKRWVCFALIVPIVFATTSSFSVLSLVAGVSVYLYTRIKARYFLLITAVCSLIAICSMIYIPKLKYALGDSGRFEVWQEVVIQYWNFPLIKKLTGYGLGSFSAIFPLVQPFNTKQYGVFIHAHNEYLQLLFEGGIIGVCVLFYLFYVLFRAFKRGLPEYCWAHLAILTVFLANSIGSFPLHLMPHGVIALWSFILIASEPKALLN